MVTPPPRFDLFLSHHGRDTPLVEEGVRQPLMVLACATACAARLEVAP